VVFNVVSGSRGMI